MNLNGIFTLHEPAMNLRMKRSEILASNLANADTPGYTAKDIAFYEILSQVEQGTRSLSTSNPVHYEESKLTPQFDMKYRLPLLPSLDGNTVDTQMENGRFAENSMRYLASLRFLDLKIKNTLIAIKGE